MYSILNDVSFKARKGEILGIAGLDGSGRTETLETIFGIATRKSGTIKLDGKQVSNKNAQDSIKNGFALLTEERRATGIFGILNIRENTVISSLKLHILCCVSHDQFLCRLFCVNLSGKSSTGHNHDTVTDSEKLRHF